MKGSTKKPLTIGLVARQASVGVETVRFYERQGLIEEPPRRLSGYREYGDDVVPRLGFIRRAKNLGFTLKEIKELLSLRRDPSTPVADVRRRAEAKIADIETKIRTKETCSTNSFLCASENEESSGKTDFGVLWNRNNCGVSLVTRTGP